MEEEKKYTLIEDYELPSKGKIYEPPIDPHVTLRSMTTREEMRRLSPSTTPYKNLAEIIQDCLTTKLSVPVYDMCLGDYEYLLHKLRVVSYSPDYKMSVVCPNCGQAQEITLNLDELKAKEFKEKDIKSLLSVTLPVSKKAIRLKFQTPRITDEIELKVQEFKKHNTGPDIDPTIEYTLLALIDTVDGVKLGTTALDEFIVNLPVKDTRCLMLKIGQFNEGVGLNTTFTCTCKACGYEIPASFRFTKEFFGPTND